jgi:hypothetical protein
MRHHASPSCGCENCRLRTDQVQQERDRRAGDALDVVARNDLGAPILASPAALGGRLYIRTRDELICIGQRP